MAQQQLDEISAKLAASVGRQRLKQGQGLQDALSTPGLSPHLRKGLKHVTNRAFSRSKKAYEYAFRKNVARGEAMSKLDEMATDQQGSDYRSQAAKQTLDMAAAAKKLKKGVTMREQFSPIGDMITLVANQQPGEATTVLTDLLSVRISDSLASRKQEIAQSLFAPSADALAEEAEQLDEISLKTKFSAYKKASENEESGQPRERARSKSLTARIERDVEKKHGAEMAANLGRAAAVQHYGRKAAMREEAEQLDEQPTRKHFQQVADVIKAHPDAAKRKELAAHHSGIFKAQNPRFDHKRFYAAAGAGEPGV